MIFESEDFKLSAEYFYRKYGVGWYSLFSALEGLANIKSDYAADRDYILTIFGHSEISHDFDAVREVMQYKLRLKNRTAFLDEGLAVLRICKLFSMLDKAIYDAPDNDEGFRTFCLNHPLWQRIEKQALICLELFKKNKFERISG